MRGSEMERRIRRPKSHKRNRTIKLRCLTPYRLDLWRALRCLALLSLVKRSQGLLYAKLGIKLWVKLVTLLSQLFLLMRMINGRSLLSLMRFFIMKRLKSSLTWRRIGRRQFRQIWIGRSRRRIRGSIMRKCRIQLMRRWWRSITAI